MTTLAAEANRIEEHEGGCIVILDKTGDTKHLWSRDSEVEVEAARKLFDDMIAKGYQAWSVTRKGDKDAKIREFDPNAEKIVFTPAIVGG